ncbi:MAG: hypothetical protein A3C30_02770 [Candidatus Levybacteria bacterium RIFCSPHIGHO2_02_FULL_40_18]|nr:MAG: hypothetical protein A2869_05210 [Candidatus Levybacteria bacterium RIFCSPHIGHO2_01_FULL_40_58]OGH26899.1 MAG: hypothetical protein A3C30_02770 [Candidatus Levybacteria bacterium RIFCSPHIGHO2_02_FULL_40_18]OGH32021.1 MAG: hypothetical protein A3E43_03750 [Candidatus Levybacteria bacterium RIFCSPHIGHO2_12_FULL_40_31]OGH40857.1 MAG: hypothetical protein A2894_04650 [Candidatus Levybacteria bacterium RIFCSPLOWO2_01_FULL_40_64]OGH49624.1 MAG: hypothetical protein A3I54_04940 [Candidatus Lev
MNKVLLNSLGVAGLITLLVLAYVGFALLNLEKKRAENEARYQCAVSSKYEIRDGDANVSFPVKEVYKECLREKEID